MMIQKLRLCLAYIEAFVGHWDRSTSGGMENSAQSGANHLGRLFGVG